MECATEHVQKYGILSTDGKLGTLRDTTIFFIIEEAKKTISKFTRNRENTAISFCFTI